MFDNDEKGGYVAFRSNELTSEACSFIEMADGIAEEKGCTRAEALTALSIAMQEYNTNVSKSICYHLSSKKTPKRVVK